jgi:hypothetical protein
MSLERKASLVMAIVCLVTIPYALTQGDWKSVGFLVLIYFLLLRSYRSLKRL